MRNPTLPDRPAPPAPAADPLGCVLARLAACNDSLVREWGAALRDAGQVAAEAGGDVNVESPAPMRCRRRTV